MSKESPNFRDARQVKIQARLGQLSIPVNQLTIEHTVDMLPTVSLSAQVDSSQNSRQRAEAPAGVEIDLGRFQRVNRTFQERWANEFSVTPDLHVSVDDGAGNLRQVNMFSGNMGTYLEAGRVNIRIDGVHPLMVLTGFNGIIYNNNPDRYLFKEGSKTSSVFELLVKILDYLMDGHSSQEKNFRPIHRLNRAIRPLLDPLLTVSRDSTRVEPFASEEFVPANLYEFLRRLLTASPDLLQTIQMFTREFWMQVTYDLDGRARIEYNRMLESPGDRVIEIPQQDIRHVFAGLYRVPILQTLIYGGGSDYYNVSGSNGAGEVELLAASGVPVLENSPYTIGRFPTSVPDSAVGRYHTIPSPEWLPRLVEVNSDSSKITGIGSRKTAIIGAEEKRRTYAKAKWDNRKDCLEFFARLAFRKEYLKEATGTVSAPLNLGLLPGRTYQVNSINGVPLFQGYLRSVSHEVMIGSGQNTGNASSRMEFSHILSADTKIDALEPRAEDPESREL